MNVLCAVFVYSCPGFKSSVRERMLYSSSKEPVVSSIEQDFSIAIEKKVSTAIATYMYYEICVKTQSDQSDYILRTYSIIVFK